MASPRIPLASVLLAVLLFVSAARTRAIRFTLDRRECLTYHVHFVGDIVHGSFVVVNANSWGDWEHSGVDLEVQDPDGYKAFTTQGQTDAMFEFMSERDGDYKFCFSNNSPIFETVALEVFIGHQVKPEDVARDEHVEPLVGRLRNLYGSVTAIFHEQRWFHAQSERQNELAKATTRRLIGKTIFQSLSLLACGVLQVYLLRRLFERKLGKSFV